jgi:hypothetical protein
LLKILKYLLPLYIGAALGPLGGFGVVTLLPVLAGICKNRRVSLNGDELVAKFIEEVTAQTGVVHRVEDNRTALAALTVIVQAEKISTVMASNDDALSALNLPAWGKENGVNILNSRSFNAR